MAITNEKLEEIDRLWNSYFFPNTETLRNKLNIYDKEELQKKEAEIKAVQDSIDAWEKWYKELTREIDKVEYEHAKLRQGIVEDSRGMYYAVTETVNVYEKLKEAIEAAGKAQNEYNKFDPEDFETDFGENLTNEALQKAQAKYDQDKAEYDMALGDIENYKTWLQKGNNGK